MIAGMEVTRKHITVVTGGARGIGAAICTRLAAEGHDVVIGYRSAADRAREVAAAVEAAGARAITVELDTADPAGVDRLFDAAAELGPITGLVNNAGIVGPVGRLVDIPIDELERVYAVNVVGVLLCARRAARDMLEHDGGAIVNISSGAAIGPGRAPFKDARPANGGTMYGATKAALERFTQGLAQEVAGHNISVTAVSPSQVVPTAGTVYHKLVKGMDDPNGEPPIYMAKAVLLLASEPAEKINGRVTYSQQILSEYGLLGDRKPTGRGVSVKGTGYSQI